MLSLEIIGNPFLFTPEGASARVEKETLKKPKSSVATKHRKSAGTEAVFASTLTFSTLNRLACNTNFFSLYCQEIGRRSGTQSSKKGFYICEKKE